MKEPWPFANIANILMWVIAYLGDLLLEMILRDDFIWGRGMKEKKKSGGGDVRAKALSRAAIGIKPKTRFRFFPNLAHGGSLCAPLTSLAARRKSRFAEKKSASPKKKLRLWLKMAHRVYQGEHVPTCGGLPKPTLRGSSLWLRLSPSCASGFAFRLHGEIHNTPSPMASLPLAAI